MKAPRSIAPASGGPLIAAPALCRAGTRRRRPDLPAGPGLDAVSGSLMVRAAGAQIEVERPAAGASRPAPTNGRCASRTSSAARGPARRALQRVGRRHRARSLRLPGKAELDRQLGAAGVASARISRGDASTRPAGPCWLAGSTGCARKPPPTSGAASGTFRPPGRRGETPVELGDAPRLEAPAGRRRPGPGRSPARPGPRPQPGGRREPAPLYLALTLPAGVPEPALEPVGCRCRPLDRGDPRT